MNILTIAAHPDDETLGCGGTLLKHRAAGDHLFWVIVTQAHNPQWTAQTIEQKTAEVERVSQAYGMTQHFRLGFPAARLDTVPQAELIERIRAVIAEVRPERVYLVHQGDVHSDHRAVFAATMSALKPFAMAQAGVRRVLSYETLSSTEAAPPYVERTFMPNVFSEITPYLERKIELMRLYETETHPDPLPRGPSAIRALARYRGATIGTEYAEAFMLIREIL
ncbi:MAG: PIG-L deacetylase family protein [Candidatus Omnitrophota bacterium]|nr:PIG-L deacetylase family protein [Candidatus Omnitrophota bacterium]